MYVNEDDKCDIDDMADFLLHRFFEIFEANLEDDSEMEVSTRQYVIMCRLPRLFWHSGRSARLATSLELKP